jgi:ATP-dependent helicase/nuclease subunit B
MQTFLDKVAEWMMERHPHGMNRICLITPNRRAGLFLKKYFANRVQTAMWAPDILSMEDFTGRITGITMQEPVALLLDFYQTYRDIEQGEAEPLEEFLKWAPMLIKDFNDIDAHLPEPHKIFENVLDVKRIESWNPDGQPMTDFQKKYMAFFEKFKTWHGAFTDNLLQRKTAYPGLAYRRAANMLTSDNQPAIPWDRIYFTGFNALNQAEETIIRSIIKMGKAEVLWDADRYYMENHNHEAGLFLRKYRSRWNLNDFSFTGDHFSIHKKNINIYGVAKNVNQAKLAANILKTLPFEDIPLQQTAIVLANEDLLLPVLNSIPDEVGKINITMGYPIRKTTIYGLFDALFQMHITTLRMKTARPDQKTAFYFKDLARFFRHPAIMVLMQSQRSSMAPEVFINKLFQSKKTFLYFQSLGEMWGDRHEFEKLFAPWFAPFAIQPHSIVQGLKTLSKSLDKDYRNYAQQEEISIENTPWFTDFEALFTINTILQKLDNYLAEHTEINDLRILFMLFQAMARESKLVLSGEPLVGLQVMGMLETRNLDFKNLIILSANEDILPTSKSNNSLIPFDVKAFFGIPVYKEKDAIFAYHFYRLLQRAENIHIIYNTQTQDMGSSEKSRYITQLQMEMPAWNPNITITEKIVPLPSASETADQEILIPKTDEIMHLLEAINEKGFSPTSLIHYINCSLLFYFRHIAGIKEVITPEETLQANTLGTVVHQVLEQLYDDEKLTGQVLHPRHIDNMLPRVEKVTAQQFEVVYAGGDVSSGKNLLLTKVAARHVKNFLHQEKAFLLELEKENRSLTYIRAEEQLTAMVNMQINNSDKQIKFRGFADRIDKLENTIRIIDYKTGKVGREELTFDQWEDIITNTKLGKSFQLLMYAMLYHRTHGSNYMIQPGIISFRHLTAGMLNLTAAGYSGTIEQEAIKWFEEQLQILMANIYDTGLPFTRTDDEKVCANCDFKVVCNR